jgi:predicted transcriptional regulator
LAETGRVLRRAGSSLAAVVEDGRLLGTVSEHDIVVSACSVGFDPEALAVGEICNTHPLLCPFDVDLRFALRLMREHQQGSLLLTDGNDDPAGIVSLLELLELFEGLAPAESSEPAPEYVHRVRGDTLT